MVVSRFAELHSAAEKREGGEDLKPRDQRPSQRCHASRERDLSSPIHSDGTTPVLNLRSAERSSPFFDVFVTLDNDAKMPANGNPLNCTMDPDCHQWTTDMQEHHPVLSICPPARREAKTNVTFSCLADGWWMLVTSCIGLSWVYAAYRIVHNVQATTQQPDTAIPIPV